MDVTASYIRPDIARPSSGGLNQRERTNKESFWRTSMSVIARKLRVLATAQRNGLMNHLLQARVRRAQAGPRHRRSRATGRAAHAWAGRGSRRARASYR